mmetsp:Transcript_29462/g.57427  ORF Transcript_29462/g.57427 Transcript_29462/m.57427 type:complete len:107 (-) Transcript_29462:175-495(-)
MVGHDEGNRNHATNEEGIDHALDEKITHAERKSDNVRASGDQKSVGGHNATTNESDCKIVSESADANPSPDPMVVSRNEDNFHFAILSNASGLNLPVAINLTGFTP